MRYIEKTSAVFVLACAFTSTPAVAADWSGFYIGVNDISQTVTGDWKTTETRDPNGPEIDPTSDPDASLKSKESDVGLRIGYNLNVGSWVFGLEAFNESIEHHDSIDDRIPGLGNTSSDPTSFVDLHAKSDDTLLRLRGGFLITQSLLLYLTAGDTKLDVTVTSTCPADTWVCNPAFGDQSFSNSKGLSKTAVGAGVEFALNNFLLRAEYMKVDFGDFSFTAIPDQINSSFGADATVGVESESLQFGVSYAF